MLGGLNRFIVMPGLIAGIARRRFRGGQAGAAIHDDPARRSARAAGSAGHGGDPEFHLATDGGIADKTADQFTKPSSGKNL